MPPIPHSAFRTPHWKGFKLVGFVGFCAIALFLGPFCPRIPTPTELCNKAQGWLPTSDVGGLPWEANQKNPFPLPLWEGAGGGFPSETAMVKRDSSPEPRFAKLAFQQTSSSSWHRISRSHLHRKSKTNPNRHGLRWQGPLRQRFQTAYETGCATGSSTT